MIRNWLRKWLGVDEVDMRLNIEIRAFQDLLEKKRIAKWARVFQYTPGMSLKAPGPDPISLEKMQADIARIDGHLRGRFPANRYKAKKRNDWRK